MIFLRAEAYNNQQKWQIYSFSASAQKGFNLLSWLYLKNFDGAAS